MKIAIVGAGSLGTLFGGLLARTEHDVWLLHHREEYVEALREGGVRIRSESLPDAPIDVDVRATTDAAEVGEADLAIVLVKAHVTRAALEDHAACVGPDTHLLTLQNGLDCYDELIAFADEGRALGGVTRHGVQLVEPGVVEHTIDGPTTLGGPDGAFARRVADAFDSAGLGDVSVVEDPRPAIWRKQMRALPIKPVAALTRLPRSGIAADEDLIALVRRLMEEAGAVAEARGIAVDVDAIFEAFVDDLAGSDHRSSMLQDVEAGRKTEIDAVNGALVEFAEEDGIDVPFNRALTALVRGLERSYL